MRRQLKGKGTPQKLLTGGERKGNGVFYNPV